MFVSFLVCSVEIKHYYYLVADDAWLGTEERNIQWLVSLECSLMMYYVSPLFACREKLWNGATMMFVGGSQELKTRNQ
jgi:hypothetical protein